MILAGVLMSGEQERKLRKENIKDSKMLSNTERFSLSKTIKSNSKDYKIVKTYPKEIDESENLNTLEAKKSAEIINLINTGKIKQETMKVVVDCPSVNTSAWQRTMEGFIKNLDNLKILCEHKADANHLTVSAASILAKNMREEEVAKIKKEFGETGSGYPADPTTKRFLAERGKELKDSGIFRKSWSTWKKMFPEPGQATLEGF